MTAPRGTDRPANGAESAGGFHGIDNSAEIEVDAAGSSSTPRTAGTTASRSYKIDPKVGSLTTVDRVSTQGKTPRKFKIDPTGRYLLAANQDSDSIVVFRRDAGTGKLSPTGQTVSVGSPVCIDFLAID